MAKKRVLAYFMHEHEQAATAAGASPRAMRVARARARVTRAPVARARAAQPATAGAAPAPDPGKESFYVVGFDGPVLPRVQKSFRDLGVTLDERLDKGQYVVKLRPDQVAPVENLGF